MRSYLAAFAEALILCLVLTPVVRSLARRLGAVSVPGERHVHTRAIPRLGGVAIALSALAPVFTLLFVDSSVASFIRQAPELVFGLLAGGLVMCGLGALDDVRGLSVPTKLAVQILTAVLAYYAGFRIDGVALPWLGPVSLSYFGLPFTVLWIVGVTNAVNLIDGLDGLAAGVVFFAAVSNLMVALLGDTSVGTIFVALLMTSLMGTLLGFLVYNFNPARIFMGDSGSYFLGFLLATSSIMAPLQKASTAVSLVVPVVALGVPIFDTLFSMVRRVVQRRPMFSPDRGHIHHRLMDMGATHRRAVVTLYGASVVLAGSAVAIALGRNWEIGLGLLGACVVLVGMVRAALQFESVLWRTRRAQPEPRLAGLRRAIPGLLGELSRVDSRERLSAALDALRAACDVDYAAVAVRGQVCLESGAAAEDFAGAFSLEFGADCSLLLRDPDDLAVGPRSEAMLELWVDQAIGQVTRYAISRDESSKDAARSATETPGGDSRSGR
jgi:UDP-GlcNAc:undecaprenyl-phosphate/decaprenyl-phosphate GlcNAc-1-phosphate transferase